MSSKTRVIVLSGASLLALAALVYGLGSSGTAPDIPPEQTPTAENAPPPPPIRNADQSLPNIILIALDTVRADQLGCYGNEQVKTPSMDTLARESVLFENCYSTAPWTLPSFASVFTGLYPYHHATCGGDYKRLDPSFPTLAEILDEEGFETRSWLAVSYLGPAFGMTRGFQVHRLVVGTDISRRLYKYRNELIQFARHPPKTPFLMMAHYFDAHAPYEPPNPFDGMYYSGDPRDSTKNSIDVIYEGTNRARLGHDPETLYGWLDGITDIEYPVKQYSAGITHLDNYVGELVANLRRSGVLDRSILVVFADHGEHLVEHDIYFTHGLPYEEALRVPLMIRLPRGVGGGRRISGDVSLVDLLPTLLELLGLEYPDRPELPALDGISLGETLRSGAEPPERILFAEQGAREGQSLVKAAWNRHYRLLWFDITGEQHYELYDRRKDRAETQDLAGQGQPAEEELREAMWSFFDPDSPVTARPIEPSQPIDPEVLERLRSLGYAH